MPKKLAKEAIILVLDNILDAVNNSTPETRYKMMQAANMAGAAINISKTTACHSIAYPITSYFKISHGHAVGMTLGELIKFNYGVSEKDCSDKRGVNYIKNTIMEISKILNCRNPKEAGDKIYSLMRSIGLETHFSEIGIKKSDLGIIIKNGLDPQRIKNNPREITKKWIKKILEKIY